MGERRPTRGMNWRVRHPVTAPRLHGIENELARWIEKGETPDMKALAKALRQHGGIEDEPA